MEAKVVKTAANNRSMSERDIAKKCKNNQIQDYQSKEQEQFQVLLKEKNTEEIHTAIKRGNKTSKKTVQQFYAK